MMRFLFSLLLIAYELILPALVVAQNVDDLPSPKDIAKLLEEKRNRSRIKRDEMLNQAMASMPKNINPKIDPAKIAEFLAAFPELRDPKNFERLRELVKEQMEKEQTGKQPQIENPQNAMRNLENFFKTVNDLQKKGWIPPIEAPSIKERPKDPSVLPPEQTPAPSRQALPSDPNNSRQLEELTGWVTRNLGDSPATRGMLQDISKLIAEDRGGVGGTDFVKDVESEWKSLFDSKDNSGAFKLGDLAAGLKLPDLNSSGPSRGRSLGYSGSAGNDATDGSAGTGSSGSAGWNGLLILGCLAAAAIVLGKRLGRPKPDANANSIVDPRLWPVDPARIASREDVVKAFDFVSVATCGAEAENWHHWRIAERMGGEDPLRRETMARLAGLYEKARYTPREELFSENDLAEARARLCQIAGVSN